MTTRYIFNAPAYGKGFHAEYISADSSEEAVKFYQHDMCVLHGFAPSEEEFTIEEVEEDD